LDDAALWMEAIHRPNISAAATTLAAALTMIPLVVALSHASELEEWKRIASTDPLPEVRRAWLTAVYRSDEPPKQSERS
jgi:hypothetical protein